MKAALVLAALGIVAISAMIVVAAEGTKAEAPKGTDVTVKGEVVDLHCFMAGGARGAGHKACAVTCAKAGNPIGLVTDKGETYLLLGKDMAKPGDGLIDKMADMVTVKGTLYESGGLKAIHVSEITK
jgi:hypothetical protein